MATRVVTQIYDDALRPVGLRVTQFALLMAIRAHGPVTARQLSKLVLMERTTLSRNVRLLKRRNLVASSSGDDRRERMLALTKQGQRAISLGHPHWLEAQARVVEGIGKGRLGRLVAELSETIAAIRTE